MKYSQDNKRSKSVRFQLKLSYKKYYVYKRPDYYTSNYTAEEQAAAKAKYFADYKAEGLKPSSLSFKSYITRYKRNTYNSDVNHTITGDAIPSIDTSDTPSSSDELLSEDRDNKRDGASFFTTIFIASDELYDTRDVF
jgi:hypothetical protein